MKNIDRQLRQAGLRSTAQRRAVLGCLQVQSKPVSADELHRHLHHIDPVTIYRTLEQFEKADLLRRVVFDDGVRRYEAKGEHHHHLVCDNCGQVQDIVIPNDQKMIAGIANRHRFRARQHSMEIYGLCVHCN